MIQVGHSRNVWCTLHVRPSTKFVTFAPNNSKVTSGQKAVNMPIALASLRCILPYFLAQCLLAQKVKECKWYSLLGLSCVKLNVGFDISVVWACSYCSGSPPCVT